MYFFVAFVSFGQDQIWDKDIGLKYYDRNFILVGEEEAKIHLSFKYKFWEDSNFYFSYSQLLIWDIYTSSFPFVDLNKHPEFFYELPLTQSQFLTLGLYDHISNGVDGPLSRSRDLSFIGWNYYKKLGWADLKFKTRLMGVWATSRNNTDIKNYMGYWNANLKLSEIFGLENDLQIKFNPGSVFNFEKGSVELGYNHKLPFDLFRANIYLQLFQGTNEHILDYNKKVSKIYAGIIIFE